jgi:hypothetical protein
MQSSLHLQPQIVKLNAKFLHLQELKNRKKENIKKKKQLFYQFKTLLLVHNYYILKKYKVAAVNETMPC